MDKKPKMIIAEGNTPVSRTTYYFTGKEVFKLEGYSKLVTYFLVICAVIVVIDAIEGIALASIVISSGIIAFILAFMILWVYPKEDRISQFSLSEIQSESSAKKMTWQSISKPSINGATLLFWENGAMKKTTIKGSSADAAKFFKSR